MMTPTSVKAVATTAPSYSTATHQHQTHALVLFYDRLPKLVVLPVVTIMTVPVAYQVANTFGNAHLILIFASSFWWLLDRSLHYFAENEAELEKGKLRNEVRLPLMAVSLSVGVAFVVTQITGSYLTWYPSPVKVFGSFIRIAGALGVLELGVLLKYIGPLSIMRCSSVPLLSTPPWNPWTLLQPTDNATTNTVPPPHKEDPIGRRYRYPSVAKMAMLLVVLTCVGLLLALVGPMPSRGHYAVLTASLCIVLTPLWKYIGQTNHELDPRAYSGIPLSFSSRIMFQTMREVIPTTAVIVLAAVLTEVVIAGLVDNSSSSAGLTVSSTVALIFVTFLCLWFQKLWEECLRLSLFCQRDDLIHVISEFVDNSHLECVRIILECVLSDCSLVNDIMGTQSIALNEESRVKTLGQRYGQQLVHKLPLYVEAPLEEDMIRFNILEAFGSPKVIDEQNSIVLTWLKTDSKFVHGGLAQEIPCVPLIRGLCVVVFGMGAALRSISDTTKRTPASTHGRWELSVGGIVGLVSSATALEHFLWPNETIPPRTIQQMKNFLPVALLSLYELHTGLRLYRNMHDESPDINEAMRHCDSTAARIAGRFRMTGAATVTLDHRVVEWVEKCKTLSPAGGGDAVMALR